MALTLRTIKDRLQKSSSDTKDNTAQKLINDATPTEIKALEDEGILRLYEALTDGYESSRDKAAIKKLLVNYKYQPVDFTLTACVKKLKPIFSKDRHIKVGNRDIQTKGFSGKLLTVEFVKAIYKAEKKRLSWHEKTFLDGLGDTKGPGQIGQPAYLDVVKGSAPWTDHFTRVAIYNLLAGNGKNSSSFIDMENYKAVVPKSYCSSLYRNKHFENFIAASVLCIKIDRRIKPKRSKEDVLKFGIAMYHGMFESVYNAQINLKPKNDVDWDPVEVFLLATGDKETIDDVKYVNEVFKSLKPGP